MSCKLFNLEHFYLRETAIKSWVEVAVKYFHFECLVVDTVLSMNHLHLSSYPARAFRPSLQCTSTTPVGCGSTRARTMCTCGSFSASCSARSTTSTTSHSTGHCLSRRSPSNRRRAASQTASTRAPPNTRRVAARASAEKTTTLGVRLHPLPHTFLSRLVNYIRTFDVHLLYHRQDKLQFITL